MKIMAIDYGDAHTGVAISDPTGFLTGTTTTIHSRSADVVLSELARLVREQGAEEIVMGFPRNMDGTEGPRAELYRAFAGRVEEATGLKPVLWDEYIPAEGVPDLVLLEEEWTSLQAQQTHLKQPHMARIAALKDQYMDHMDLDMEEV